MIIFNGGRIESGPLRERADAIYNFRSVIAAKVAIPGNQELRTSVIFLLLADRVIVREYITNDTRIHNFTRNLYLPGCELQIMILQLNVRRFTKNLRVIY